MASQLYPSFHNARTRSRTPLVVNQERVAEPTTFEYPAEIREERQGSLGCMRGVAWAFGIQAVFAIVIVGLWEVVRLLR